MADEEQKEPGGPVVRERPPRKRDARLAAALRENLRRRKARARGRRQPTEDERRKD